MSALYVKRARATKNTPEHRITPMMRRMAWRVACDSQKVTVVSCLAFARQRDAEAAKAALERHGITDHETLMATPFKERCRIMLESLQW